MAQPQPEGLDALLAQARSLDAAERLEALEQLRRYAGHRKVSQTVFELRNDGDRRVRALAREILEEGDRRTSGALAVTTQARDERQLRIDELLAETNASTPFERVGAIKQLVFFLPDAKIEKKLHELKKDPDRTIRMLATNILEDAAAKQKVGDRPTANTIEDGVLVSSPYTQQPKKNWQEKTASRWGAEMIPYLGFFYLCVGLPIALSSLWVWLADEKLVQSPWLPDPAIASFVADLMLGHDDEMLLASLVAMCALLAAGGAGMLFRREWGRRAILLFHAIAFFWGLCVPFVFAKFASCGLVVVVLYFLNRRDIIASFVGAPKKPPKDTNYGDMDRKVW